MKNNLAIHSVPRSGSTWLGSIYDSHPEVIYKFQPLFSYRFKGQLSIDSTRKEVKKFFDELAIAKDDFLDQEKSKLKGRVPEFPKEKPSLLVYKSVRYHYLLPHLLNTDKKLKVIGLIRNPVSTIFSWSNAPKGFKKELGWQIMEEWDYAPKKNQNRPEEYFGYQKWKETAYLFTKLEKLFPDRFKIITYSDLLHETECTVKDAFEFSGLDFAEQTQAFLLKSRSNSNQDPYAVFKTKKSDNQWKGNLDASIIDSIVEDLENTILEKYLVI